MDICFSSLQRHFRYLWHIIELGQLGADVAVGELAVGEEVEEDEEHGEAEHEHRHELAVGEAEGAAAPPPRPRLPHLAPGGQVVLELGLGRHRVLVLVVEVVVVVVPVQLHHLYCLLQLWLMPICRGSFVVKATFVHWHWAFFGLLFVMNILMLVDNNE